MFIVLEFVTWRVTMLERVSAIASPISFSQDADMFNAGWAVDNVTARTPDGSGWNLENGKIKLTVSLACRGLRSHLYRVAFQATAVGVPG
jgi:hypothetical protein